MIESSSPNDSSIELHDQKILGIHEINLEIELEKVKILQAENHFIPTSLIHNVLEFKNQINSILKRNGLPPRYEIESVDINPNQKELKEFDDEDDKVHLQNLLIIRRTNLSHIRIEKERLAKEQVDTTTLDKMITEELVIIADLESKLYK